MTAARPAATPGELLARLAGTPDAYAQKLDLHTAMVLLVLLDESTYRGASFLDDRVLSPSTQGAWVSLAAVAEAARGIARPRPLHFIFHTGHVGSTLVSRLLDASGTVLSLREPLPLRTLADASDSLERPDSLLSTAQFESVLAVFLRLWSRGYATTQSVVLKATSSAARLAVRLLAASASSRAIYLNLRAEPYLATLLAGANTPSDLRGHGAERMRRLQSRSTVPLAPLHALSLGELAAMSWLAETLTQQDAVARCAGRVVAVDFDQLLSDVGGAMGRILGHLGLAADPRFRSELAQSPVLTRYSKAPEHAYTPGIRAEVLRDSRRDNGAEIDKGMAWLEARARADPALAAMLSVSP